MRPIWSLLALSIGLGGILLAVSLFLAGRPEASLELQNVSTIRVVSPTQFDDRVVVLLDGQEIEQLWVSRLRLVNSGDIDIGVSDFGAIDDVGRVLLISTSGSDILGIASEGSEPPGIDFELSAYGARALTLSPVLLKSGETISFAAITAERPKGFSVSGRIKGIEEVGATPSGIFDALWFRLLSGVAAGVVATIAVQGF